METVMPGQQYRITLTVDEDYLTDPNTVYPVTIDPTLTVSDNTHGAGAIEDAPIYEGYPTSNFGSYQYNRAGYAGTTYKRGRTVVRLTGMLNDEGYKAAGADRILSVNFYIADATGGTSSASVKLHPMTENLIWTESNITWYTLGNYSPYAAATATLSGGNYAMFNITELVKKWKQGQYSNGSCGFVMVGASEASVDRSMYSSEHTTASKRPYVVVEYTNEFHSTYLDADLYRNTSYAHDDGLQLRANCYGYAFRFFYNENVFYEGLPAYKSNNIYYRCYKQMPGEFADKSEDLKIYAANGSGQVEHTFWNNQELYDYYLGRPLFGSVTNETRMNYLVQLMQADANQLGYTLTECTDTELPNAFEFSDRRLIAVVVSSSDYHFYMQHSDNTWSHKPGQGEPSNQCLSEDHSKVLLNNSNIRTHAAEEIYAGGAIKFFYITKNAVVDYGHENGMKIAAGTQPAPEFTVISPNQDYAGNHFGAAKNLGVLQQVGKYGKIDYVDDVDFYIFQVQATKTYSFTASVGTGNDIVFTLYGESGKVLRSNDRETGTVSFTYSLTAGKVYAISISSPDKETFSQDRQYSCSIT